MKTFVKNTLLAMTLSTSMVLADDKAATKLDINKVLPQTVSAELPEFSKESAWTAYSPQQKARIVELQLTVDAAQPELPVLVESGSVTYTPLQKASIAGLQLTAEEAPSVPSQKAETAPEAYSPQQKALIAGLVLTAE